MHSSANGIATAIFGKRISSVSMADHVTRLNRVRGTLLGTAVGDALGLPSEGISRRRAQRLFKGRWRHRLVLNRGMISDDTEHTLFVAQPLLARALGHPLDDALNIFTKRDTSRLRLLGELSLSIWFESLLLKN